MKTTSFIGSILTNTNKIISDSDSDWRGIKTGNLIKFKNDKITYEGLNVESFVYIQDFSIVNNTTLLINDNTSVFLIKGDTLNISYKEYELLTIINIINGGKGYKINDILLLEGGVPATEIEDGLEYRALLRVAEILPGGLITKVVIENKGKYIETPTKTVNTKGGAGSGAVFEINYKLLNTRAIVERDILKIEIGDSTRITLNYPLPTPIKEGKLSVQKYSLTLNNLYSGTIKLGEIFEVAGDFTLNYGWPIILENSFSAVSILNKIHHSLDQKIKELENRIIVLESTDK